MDRVDIIIVDFPTVERHLEGVMKVFLQFDNEYIIIPIECMFILENYISLYCKKCILG
jgi:hypothetical protein